MTGTVGEGQTTGHIIASNAPASATSRRVTLIGAVACPGDAPTRHDCSRLRREVLALSRLQASGKRYSTKRLRNSSLLILPVAVWGKASTNATSFGIHHFAT